MSDKVIIKNMRVSCRVGVTEKERKRPQLILLDVEFERDLRNAARHDDISETVDYARAFELIQQKVKGREFKLLERLAGEIAENLLAHFKADQVRVRAKKKVIRGADWTGVELMRRGGLYGA